MNIHFSLFIDSGSHSDVWHRTSFIVVHGRTIHGVHKMDLLAHVTMSLILDG